MKLTENFTLKEMTKSYEAIRNNIKNIPSDSEVVNLKTLCVNVLQPIRNHYGLAVTVNSGYRSLEVNTLVKGSKTSDHIKGMAADIEIYGVPNIDLAKWIEKNLKFTQCILEFHELGVPNSGWVHVSYDPNNLKQQCLTAIIKDGKTVYLPGFQP